MTSTGAEISRAAAFAALSAASFFHNGDSSRLLNTNSPSTELMMPVKNMQRQPHTSKSAPGKIDDMVRYTIEASKVPRPAPPPPIKPDTAPRYFGATDSVPMVCVDATTPPTNTPCTSRNARNRIGAARPTCATVGKTPKSAVEIPTPTTARIIAPLRPCRSAYEPNHAEPSGRISRVTANDAYTAASESMAC